MIATLILQVSWFASALVAGGLALVSLGIVRAARTMDQQRWPEVHRALNTTVGPYLSRALALAIVATGLVAATTPVARSYFATAAALFAGVLVISLSINVPINRAVASWTAAPATWQETRARWNYFQHVRAMLAIAALAVVLAGGVTRYGG